MKIKSTRILKLLDSFGMDEGKERGKISLFAGKKVFIIWAGFTDQGRLITLTIQ